MPRGDASRIPRATRRAGCRQKSAHRRDAYGWNCLRAGPATCMVADSPMIWFWLGFFCLVVFLLYLDLGVLHRKQLGQTMRGAVLMTLGWVALGLAFSGFVFL